MTLRPDVEALLQGAIDDTLTREERETLDRLMTENIEARGRAAHLKQLTELLDSLGPAEPPAALVQDVLAQISNSAHQPSAGARGHAEARPEKPSRGISVRTRWGWGPSASEKTSVRLSAPRRRMAMNKKIIFGLAAAAVLVLAVVTFIGYPPAGDGTEATIGAARRAQAPQIEAKDVALGDTSAQAVLQTETWDQLLKDETLRTLLQDASMRARLEDADLRTALADSDILQALRSQNLSRYLLDVELIRMLKGAELSKKLDDAAVMKKFDDANLRTALRNQKFADALRDDQFRTHLARPNVAAALASPAFQNALRDQAFDAALRNPSFAESMARGSRF